MLTNWSKGLAAIALVAQCWAAGALGGTTAPSKDDVISPAVQSLADADNAFALDLYGRLRTTAGNLFVSPYSIDVALLMVRAGAAGATGDEMSKTLKLPDLNASELSPAISALTRRFNSDAADQGYELHVANALWGQAGKSFRPAYLAQLHDSFAAELNGVDFHMPQDAAATINTWVAQKTGGRIRDLISAGALNDRTKLVLTNAIYFKGDWKQPFRKTATHDAPWHDGASVDTAGQSNLTTAPVDNVPMMFQAGPFEYMKSDELSALQMPYRGDNLAMLVLLPARMDGLADLERSLDSKRLAEIIGGLRHEHKVEVSLPKFNLETKYELSHTLAAMGMPALFSPQADLSGIDGSRDLSVTGVIHKAFVKVDETGTEAAAATGVMIATMAMRQRTVFLADHPFIFLIRDMKTGTILFIGRVVHPANA